MPKYKKRTDGRYSTSVIIGYGDDGKAKRKILYAKTIRELEIKAGEYRGLQDKGIAPGKSITFDEWSKKWLKLYKSTKEYNTELMYTRTVKNHLKLLGNIPLTKLKKHDLQQLLNDIVAKGHYRTAEIVKLTLSQIINTAIDEHYIFYDITRGLSLPTKIKKKKRALTDDEYERLKNAPLTQKQRLFVDILLYTGIRRGEALALTINDIDLKNRSISINKSIVFKENNALIKNTPKTSAGNRNIYISDLLFESLQQNIPKDSDYLFTMIKSDELMTKSSYVKFWNSISKSANLPKDVTAHVLRHNFATKLYYGNIDVKTAQKLLGHSNISITLDIYTHLKELDEETTDKLNNLF